MIGTAESQVPSANYSEKVYVMSKVFIKTALTNPPHGLADIIQWLYLSCQPGPHLLRRVLDDSRKLLANSTAVSAGGSSEADTNERGKTGAKLSTGASILLRRSVDWLEEFTRRNDEDTVSMHSYIA